MEDETLNNILNILQNSSNNTNTNQTSNASSNNDIQTLLIKFLLSGGLNQIMNLRNQNTTASSAQSTPAPQPEKPRTIDLINYQRLD